MYQIDFTKQALKEIAHLKKSDPVGYSKLQKLLTDLTQHPTTGIGRPKPLRHNMTGLYSRRITDKHRLLYRIDNDRLLVLVLSVLGHYDDH